MVKYDPNDPSDPIDFLDLADLDRSQLHIQQNCARKATWYPFLLNKFLNISGDINGVWIQDFSNRYRSSLLQGDHTVQGVQEVGGRSREQGREGVDARLTNHCKPKGQNSQLGECSMQTWGSGIKRFLPPPLLLLLRLTLNVLCTGFSKLV